MTVFGSGGPGGERRWTARNRVVLSRTGWPGDSRGLHQLVAVRFPQGSRCRRRRSGSRLALREISRDKYVPALTRAPTADHFCLYIIIIELSVHSECCTNLIVALKALCSIIIAQLILKLEQF
jgi:hypothetical protein